MTINAFKIIAKSFFIKASDQSVHLGFQEETAQKYLTDNTGMELSSPLVLTHLEVTGDFSLLSYLSTAPLTLNCSLYLKHIALIT